MFVMDACKCQGKAELFIAQRLYDIDLPSVLRFIA